MSKSENYVLEGINNTYSIWNARFKKAYQKKGYSQAGLARKLAQSYPGLFPSEWAQEDEQQNKEDEIASSRGQTRISDWCNVGKNGNKFPSYERMLAIAETVGEPLPFLLGQINGHTFQEQEVADYLGIEVEGVQGIRSATESDHRKDRPWYDVMGGITASEALTRLFAATDFSTKFTQDLVQLLNPPPDLPHNNQPYEQGLWQWTVANWKNSCMFRLSNDLTEICSKIKENLVKKRSELEKEEMKNEEKWSNIPFIDLLENQRYGKDINEVATMLRNTQIVSEEIIELIMKQTTESLHSNPEMTYGQWKKLIRTTLENLAAEGKFTIDEPVVKETFRFLGVTAARETGLNQNNMFTSGSKRGRAEN